MPEFRFRLPIGWTLRPHQCATIFLVGLDGMAWPCQVRLESEGEGTEDGPILHLFRNQPESGKLYFSYPFRDRGEMLICTGTIPVGDETVDLMTELARGTLNRLRNQLSIWQEGGLAISSTIQEMVAQSIRLLGESIMASEPATRDEMARRAIETGMDAIFELANAFGRLISLIRMGQRGQAHFWTANAAGQGEQYLPSVEDPHFDLLQQTGWVASQNGGIPPAPSVTKRIILGPWLDTSAGGLHPELLELEDFPERKSKLHQRCRLELESLPSQTALIHLVKGLNGIGHQHLSYSQQLQLTEELLMLVEEASDDLPVMVSFDYPWAERMANTVGGIPPLQIADSLLRRGANIACLGLEVNLDYWPNGSAIRDPLQWIELVDVWSQFDLPLVFCLRVPSGGEPIDDNQPIDRSVNRARGGMTDSQRIAFLQTVLPMLVARPAVHGVIWSDWQDGDDPRYSDGGIVDSRGTPKPIKAAIVQLRHAIDQKLT